MSDKTIWVLVDDRAGNYSQALGVAEALGMPYTLKQIRFDPLIRLPNPLLWWNRLGITAATRGELAPPWPDITITSARRLGLVAAYIKHKSPATFTAQIQWPGYTGVKLDMIATPLHDNIPEGGNILCTVGAPHRVRPEKLAREAAKWSAQLAHLPQPRIALVIGGSDNPEHFAVQHAVSLARLASALAQRHGGSLLVTTSRRTGPQFAQHLARHLTCPYTLFEWRPVGDGQNPYYGYLGLADAVVVTSDSVSMASEACSTGKPVFLYEVPDVMSRKHKTFMQALYSRKLAQPLNESSVFFTPSGKLDDSARIAQEIRKRTGI